MKPTWKKYLLYGSAIIAVVALVMAGYSAAWTGFGDYVPPDREFVRGKTLWDWLELLIIPLVLGIGAFYLQSAERAADRKTAEDRAKLERELATDRQQETALQGYLDRMTELLLKENLRTSANEEVRNVARIRTLAVLRGLDSKRKVIVVVFLYESGLIVQPAVVDLSYCDLSFAELPETNLSRANLGGVDLSGARLGFADLNDAYLAEAYLGGTCLGGADLSGADLSNAYLGEADLSGADLSGADLSGADLSKARVSAEQLESVASLEGTTMPDGTKHA